MSDVKEELFGSAEQGDPTTFDKRDNTTLFGQSDEKPSGAHVFGEGETFEAVVVEEKPKKTVVEDQEVDVVEFHIADEPFVNDQPQNGAVNKDKGKEKAKDKEEKMVDVPTEDQPVAEGEDKIYDISINDTHTELENEDDNETAFTVSVTLQ